MFAAFKFNGRSIGEPEGIVSHYINPALVTFIEPRDDSSCTVHFGREHKVHLPVSAETAVTDIQAAAGRRA